MITDEEEEPVGRNGGVGNHDGLQMEATICHKYNGIRIALQNRGCAP